MAMIHFFSYIKKWIIYPRRSGLFLSSLSHLKDQKWALVSHHRLREFKHQLSSIMTKPSGISESAETDTLLEWADEISPSFPPCTVYERPDRGVCALGLNLTALALGVGWWAQSLVFGVVKIILKSKLEWNWQVMAAGAHSGLQVSYLELRYVRSSVQPSGDGGSEQCQNKLTNKRSKVRWVQVCCCWTSLGKLGCSSSTEEEEPAAISAGEAVRKAREDAIASHSSGKHLSFEMRLGKSILKAKPKEKLNSWLCSLPFQGGKELDSLTWL